MSTDEAMHSILVAYYHDTLGLPDWEKAVERRVHLKLDGQIRRITAFVDVAGKCVLDVGCGFGDMMLGLLQAGAAEVVGIDPDDQWTAVAAARGAQFSDRYLVHQAVGEFLPFRSDSFDIVVSNFVVEHVDDLQRVVAEMVRVLKPGGQCVINCPNYLWPIEPHYRLPWIPFMPKQAGKRWLEWRERDPNYFLSHTHYITPFHVLKALRIAGIRHTVNLLQMSLAQPNLIMSDRLRNWVANFRYVRLPSFLIYLLAPSASILATKPVSLQWSGE